MAFWYIFSYTDKNKICTDCTKNIGGNLHEGHFILHISQ